MAWEKGFDAERRDTEHDQETLGGTLVALADAIQALTYPTPFLLVASASELIEALKIDYESGGFFDTGTFACGICLANGTTYKPWSDEALTWLKAHAAELQIDQFVGPREQLLNLCTDCAKDISGVLFDLPGSSKAVPPPVGLFPDPPRPPLNRFSGIELDD